MVEQKLARESEVLGEAYPSATLSTTNPTRTYLESTRGCGREEYMEIKKVTNHKFQFYISALEFEEGKF
jgi:hypothetical protein